MGRPEKFPEPDPPGVPVRITHTHQLSRMSLLVPVFTADQIRGGQGILEAEGETPGFPCQRGCPTQEMPLLVRNTRTVF